MSLFDVFGEAADDSSPTRGAADPSTNRRPLPPAARQPRHGIPASARPPARHAPAAPSARRRSRRSSRRKATMWRISTTAFSFIALLALVVGGIATVAYQKYNGQITRVAVLATKDPNIREAARQQSAENFLVIGSDTRAGADAKFGNVAGARSDTTMLVHLSPDRSKATVISFPRDAWVDIPDCTGANGNLVPEHSDMFNSAFSVGGPKCTIETVQKLTGIAVTHFVEIDFSGFESMVSAMGRVTVCSPQAVFDPGSGLRLRKGDNHLDGTQALAYVRARETLGDGSDLGRIKRQQLFLGAVMRQATGGSMLASPKRLNSFLNAATKAITVDRGTSFSDLRTLTSSMQGLDPRHVVFYTAPIADPNYTPPGTNMTGRVLLDLAKGRVLYDSVIHDKRPVWVTGSGKTTKVAHSGSTATPTQTPTQTTATQGSSTAAQQTCSL